MIILTKIGNWIKVDGTSVDLNAVKVSIRARSKGYKWSNRYRQGQWDGYISMYDGRSRKFPAGLIDRVISFLNHHKIPNEYRILSDWPKEPIQLNSHLNGTYARDYQLEAAELALKYEYGIFDMATNAGKTVVMAMLVNSVISSVIVVPTRNLLWQTYEKITKLTGMDVGLVGDGHFDTYGYYHYISTNASFPKFVEIGWAPHLLLVDECHHGKANELYKAGMDVNSRLRIGMSGTPLTEAQISYKDVDNLRLFGLLGPVRYKVSNDYLINEGFSSKPIIKMHTITRPDLIDKLNGTKAYDIAVVNNPHRNTVIADIVKNFDGAILVLARRVRHVKELAKRIPEAVALTGSSSTEDIESAKAAMSAGKLRVIIASSIFNEGVDIPAIDGLVIAGAGKGRRKILQQVGRGLRVRGTSDSLTVHDFIDDTHKVLLKNSLTRYDLYDSEGFDIEVIETIAADLVS